MARVYAGITQVTGAMLIIDHRSCPQRSTAGEPDGRHTSLCMRSGPWPTRGSKNRAAGQAEARAGGKNGLVDSTAKWVSWNALTELTARSSRAAPCVRYEDFTAAPRYMIEAILDFVCVPTRQGGFRDEQTAELAAEHHGLGQSEPVPDGDGGNPRRRRLASRAAEARSVLTTAMAWPLMARYGYLP